MSYNCRLYFNSGFNSSNIPDSPALLNTINFLDVPALEIMQDKFLSEIRVKAKWEDIQDCDYLRLLNTTNNKQWFYSVEAIAMQATDCALLSVIPDFITSIGGVANLKIIDGITERVHVTDDTFGKYTEPDPLTAPVEPLQISKVWVQISDKAYTLIESTLDIPLQMNETKGTTYTDTNTETGEAVTVVVPSIATDFVLDNFQTQFKLSENDKTIAQGTKIYNLSNSKVATGAQYTVAQTIKAGLNRLRSLGVESAIISQVKIPSSYVELNESGNALIGGKYSWSIVRQIIGKWSENAIDIPYVYTEAKNNRLNYGEFTKYGIISTSGESCEYDAEEIIETGSISPHIKKVGDPRPTGKPYFRFKTVNGDSSELGFFRNCISGLPWKNVPLVYREASGNALNTLRYENSKMLSTESYQYGTAQNELAKFKNVSDATLGVVGNLLGGDLGGAVSSLYNPLFTGTSLEIQQMFRTNSTNVSRRNELSELAIANNVVTPTVNFPMNAEFMRDFYGNGVLVYRYIYSQNDINRIDKLLTMYGYKYSKPLELTDFTNRKNFNFVLSRNVTLSGYSKWINNALAEQIANGVRIWHVLPDNSYYTNNPVKEN